MSSKVWLYQSDRAIGSDEQKVLQNQLNDFAQHWKAHGKNLEAKFWFHNPFLLICEVDESLWSASGCSIDAKVHFLKSLGKQNNIDFFVRMKTIVHVNQDYEQRNFDEVKNLSSTCTVFNPSVTNSQDLNALFTPIEASPLKRLFV